MSSNVKQWCPDMLKGVDTILFDGDGVLYRYEKPICGAGEVLRCLKKMNKTVLFVTNNSTKSRAKCAEKLKKVLGVQVEKEQIFCTSYAIAKNLERKGFKSNGKKVYVIGLSGIIDELKDAGIPYVWCEKIHKLQDFSTEGVTAWDEKIDGDIGAVVVGFSHRINYLQLTYAVRALGKAGNFLLCANREAEYLIGDVNVPACGPIVKFIESASKKEAVDCGKPQKVLFELVDRSVYGGLKPGRTLMIGDRLDTDIAFGKNNKLKTLLVFSGQTDEEKYFSGREKYKPTPDYWLKSVAGLLDDRNNCGERLRKRRRL